MKASRDSGSWTNDQKVEHVNAIVAAIPDLTHIALACYADNPGYHSVTYVREWFDAVHNAGKKVFFRPGLTSVTTTGTNAEKIVNWQNIVTNLSDCWADGDAWDVWPEVGVEALGTQAQYNQWIRDIIPALNTSFDAINKDVDCTFFSMIDQRWIFGSQIEAATVTAMGNKLCIDFYPMDYVGGVGRGTPAQKVNNFVVQLAIGHANYPTAECSWWRGRKSSPGQSRVSDRSGTSSGHGTRARESSLMTCGALWKGSCGLRDITYGIRINRYQVTGTFRGNHRHRRGLRP